MQKSEELVSSDMNNVITNNVMNLWRNFPQQIRNDACFSAIRSQLNGETRKLAGKNEYESLTINVNEFVASDEKLITAKNTVQLDETRLSTSAKKSGQTAKRWKYGIFFVIWLLVAWPLLTVREKIQIEHTVAIDSAHDKTMNLSYSDFGPKISINIWIGPNQEPLNFSQTVLWMRIESQTNSSMKKVIEFDHPNEEARTIQFDFYPKVQPQTEQLELSFKMKTNAEDPIVFKVFIDENPINTEVGVIAAISILIFFNVLLNADIVHRTVAAVFTTFISIGVLAALHDRPSMSDVLTWVDCESLLLILSMMVLVAFLSNTGFFEHIALYAFQISRGRIWPLINILCVISAVISMFIDNVTTILLFTPIVIKLFECLNLNPVPVLPFIILNINIGGLATLIGHPPNLIITENTYITEHGINFLTFAMHMTVGVVMTLIQTNIHLRIQCRNLHQMVKIHSDESDELEMWQKNFHDLESLNENDANDNLTEVKNLKLILAKKIDALKKRAEADAKKGLIDRKFDKKVFPESFEQLKNLYPIKNERLYRKTITILIFIILLFFVETIPTIQRLSLGWCAFMGVMLLLAITDCDLESIIQQIEWVTLLFFGAMFITMECLARLGLIHWIGKQTEYLILLADEQMRLTLAIVIILWFSALSSSVVDSTPVTAMMVKVLDSFAQNQDLNLPIKPIVFALAFGPTLGANGNLYGASSNILCADVAAKLGHKITSTQYFRIGFPVMIGNVLLVTFYLLFAHVLFEWH